MFPCYKNIDVRKKGVVLIIAMIFLVVFSALAVSIASMSGNNVQIASNQQKQGVVRAAAESGIEVQRFLLTPVTMPSSTPPSAYFSEIIDAVQDDIVDNSLNMTLDNNGSIMPVTLDSDTGREFNGRLSIEPNDLYKLHVSSTGQQNDIQFTVSVAYDIEPYQYKIFDYGLATKGPLNYTGNPTMVAINQAWEADLYIESSNSFTAMWVGGNCNFDGEIEIGNPLADVSMGGDILIAGDHGQDALDNHVHIGEGSVEFPTPLTDRFRTYAVGDVIGSTTVVGSTITDFSKGMTLVNCSIAAGTNPVFQQSVIIKGILFIESPNIVTFGRNVDLQGIIVADGDLENPGTNRIDFLGNFSSGPYPEGDEFDAIREEDGSSIIAPGFEATFQGNFSTLEGVVALSGVSFTGNVNAIIKGTIINYSNDPMLIGGNAFMSFDRVSSTKIPAGFDTHRVLSYDPDAYIENDL